MASYEVELMETTISCVFSRHLLVLMASYEVELMETWGTKVKFRLLFLMASYEVELMET